MADKRKAVAFVIGLLSTVGLTATCGADQGEVTAIDIALEPDAAMIRRADAVNARLREVYPAGYTLDATHSPHITMLQRFVPTAELGNVYAAVGKVLAGEKPNQWKLRAHKFDYVIWSGVGVTVMQIERTDELGRFQQTLIDAIAPFTTKSGTVAAFVTTKEEPDINASTIDYVRQFVPASTGSKFMPHVTVGVAPEDFLKRLLAEPFEPLIFAPAAVSVYQLGNFGTARKKLYTWAVNQ